MRRLSRILLWTAGIILTLVLLTGVVIETSFFKNWLRGVIVKQANQHINGTLAIGAFKGNLFSGVELDDVTVMMNNEPVVRIDALKTSYNIRELVSNGTTVDSVTIVHPVVAAHRIDNTWQLARLVKATDNQRKSMRRISVRHITITDGAVAIDKAQGTQNVDVPERIERLNASLGFAHDPTASTTVDVGAVSFVTVNPALELRQLSGKVTMTDESINVSNFNLRTGETAVWADGAVAQYKKTPTLAMNVSFAPLSLPEIRRFVPSMKPMNVAPTISMKLGGPTTRLATEVSAKSTAGDFAFRGTVSLGGPDRVYSGDVAVHHLDLAPFLNNPEQKSDIVVYAKIDVRGPAGFDTLRGSVSADAPLVSTHGYVVQGIRANAKIDGRKIAFDTSELAYKSNTTAAGTVEFATDQRPETRFDLRGAVKDVGFTYLPKQTHIPPAETKLSTGYHVRIVIPRKPGWHVDGEVQLQQSTVAGVTIGNGSRASFLFEPNVVQYQVDMNVLDVDLQRIGQQFNVQALANPRYKTSLNGHVVADVKGTALETMDLKASGAITDSSVFGGRIPELTFESTIANGDLHVKATGMLDKLNPAIAADNPGLEGQVTGNVDTDVTLHHLANGVDENSIEGAVTADLGPSQVGPKGSIDRAYISGDYRNALADIYDLDVTGSDIRATGHGTIAFNESDQSGFWLHADANHLESINAAINSQQSLSGIGTLDVIVGGNKKEFTVNGTVTGNGVRYGDFGALAASSKFSAKIPNLDAQQTTVTADTSATFVDIPGLQVNELTAKTDYRDKNVDFNLTAKQPERSLTAGGSLILHPDHNEVHLTAFDFQTQGMRWQTGQGHSPAVQWGGGNVDVKDFSLVNGSQEIRADGTFGKAGDNLTVNLKDVDLGVVDVLLVRPQQLWGTVNAKAVVSGTSDAPQADAEFTIANGRFRQVPYDSITGKAKYTPATVILDTKLQQNESQWLLAKGELPTSLFKGQRTADRIDFHVDSSTVDLGIIQGLTTAVSGVQGKLQAKLDVSGSAQDPRVEGGVTIQGGAVKVVDTGVDYKGIDGKINFLPDRVHIDDLHVLDRDNDYLSVTGDLGVSGLRLSNVNLGFYADNFKVLGNEMGNMHVNSSLELTGTLANPKVVGDLGVATGNIKLDPILAKLTNSAYSTSSIDIAKTEGTEASRQGILGALELALHVTIPDDLVVKADDLKTSEGPIGLGKLNLTLGGDLNVNAAPGQPITLVGNVNTVRGFYDYQGRRFTVLRDGTVRFEGDPVTALNPALDVSAERMIQAVTVRVNVKGNLRRPDIELTSIPPQEQADILALIIFNQPLNQLGEGQQLSLAQRAGSIAAGAVANQLTGSIANSLNLDQFEVNLSPDSGSAAEVTVGQQVGQSLYLKVQQGVGNNSQTNFVLEYEFAKWLRLQTNVLEGSTTQQQLFQKVKSTGADLVFSFQFK